MDEVPYGMEEPQAVVVPLVSFEVEYMNGNEERYEPTLISAKAVFKLRARNFGVGTLSAESMYANAYDEWKVIAKIDDLVCFTGFVVMENEPYQLRNKPYNVVVTATDGLGLLKYIPLTKLDGTNFNGRNTMMQYIAAALSKTNLNLNIRAYVNIFNTAHQNRYVQGAPDMLTQTKIHHRTFLNDAGDFVDCYTALEILLGKWCNLFQYEGEWLINEISEIQYTYGNRKYTKYSYTGVKTGTATDFDDTAIIGKEQKIQPINIDQYVSYLTPVKSVKTVFNYEVPKDLINNDRIRGLGPFNAALSTTSRQAYDLLGWSQKVGDPSNLTNYTGSYKSFIAVEKDIYGTETDRYYVLQKDPVSNSGVGYLIRNDNSDFFVDAGDKLDISFSYRTSIDVGGTGLMTLAGVYILKSGTTGASRTDWYSLNQSGNWAINDLGNSHFGDASLDTTQWNSITVSSKAIPVNGICYIFLKTGWSGSTTELHIKELNINYTPYVKGAKFDVKGDYWLTEQNVNIKDTIDEDIKISDSSKRIIKGALFDSSGDALLNPTWYRLGYTEQKHFKELVNFGRYRGQYRRIRKVSGTFKGVTWTPNGTVIFHPLTFHRPFLIEFEQASGINALYCLAAPLNIDYLSCQWKGTFIDVAHHGLSQNGEIGDKHVFNYIFN